MDIYLQVDSEELLRSEAVALRVRGTLNLTSGQNENDLHIAFKHLIEKVGRVSPPQQGLQRFDLIAIDLI